MMVESVHIAPDASDRPQVDRRRALRRESDLPARLLPVAGPAVQLWTLIGAGIVIGSGLYTLAREARLRRRPAAGA